MKESGPLAGKNGTNVVSGGGDQTKQDRTGQPGDKPLQIWKKKEAVREVVDGNLPAPNDQIIGNMDSLPTIAPIISDANIVTTPSDLEIAIDVSETRIHCDDFAVLKKGGEVSSVMNVPSKVIQVQKVVTERDDNLKGEDVVASTEFISPEIIQREMEVRMLPLTENAAVNVTSPSDVEIAVDVSAPRVYQVTHAESVMENEHDVSSLLNGPESTHECDFMQRAMMPLSYPAELLSTPAGNVLNRGTEGRVAAVSDSPSAQQLGGVVLPTGAELEKLKAIAEDITRQLGEGITEGLAELVKNEEDFDEDGEEGAGDGTRSLDRERVRREAQNNIINQVTARLNLDSVMELLPSVK